MTPSNIQHPSLQAWANRDAQWATIVTVTALLTIRPRFVRFVRLRDLEPRVHVFVVRLDVFVLRQRVTARQGP